MVNDVKKQHVCDIYKFFWRLLSNSHQIFICFRLYIDLNKFVNVANIQYMFKDFQLSYKDINWSVPGQISTSSGCPGDDVGESNAVFNQFVVVIGIQLFRDKTRQEQTLPYKNQNSLHKVFSNFNYFFIFNQNIFRPNFKHHKCIAKEKQKQRKLPVQSNR